MNRSYNEEGRLCQFPSSVPSIESCLPLAGSCATGNSKNNKKKVLPDVVVRTWIWHLGDWHRIDFKASEICSWIHFFFLSLSLISPLSSPGLAMWSSLTSFSPCILIGKGLPGIASLSSEISCVPWHTCLQRYFHEYVPEYPERNKPSRIDLKKRFQGFLETKRELNQR